MSVPGQAGSDGSIPILMKNGGGGHQPSGRGSDGSIPTLLKNG